MFNIAYVGKRFERVKKIIVDHTRANVTDYTLKNEIPETEDIVVIDSSRHVTRLKVCGRGTVGVVLSHNRNGLLCLMKNGIKCITCGMSGKNTISMSSTEYGKSVTLGRRIVALNGEIVETGDFVFKTEITDDDECLMLAAAAILLAKV